MLKKSKIELVLIFLWIYKIVSKEELTFSNFVKNKYIIALTNKK